MHKTFYASGFLYHQNTNQILLQKKTNSQSPNWSLFKGEGSGGNTAETIFKKAVYKILKIRIALDNINPVYDYFNQAVKKNSYILFADVSAVKSYLNRNGTIFSWFTVKQLSKIQMSQQTAHDIIIGQRVIDARDRKRQGLQTLT